MIILQNPKYPENLAGVIRASACLGDAMPVIWTGDRLDRAMGRVKALSAGHGLARKERLMREFRHPDYKYVQWENSNKPFDLAREMLGSNIVPVCIEVDGTEDLTTFDHPRNAVYVFGPEDGSVDQVFRRLCHRFVTIPTTHCLNLAATVNVVLADRLMKQRRNEQCGFY